MQSKRILYLGGFELPDKNAAAQRVMANAMLLREMGYEVLLYGLGTKDNYGEHMVDGFLTFSQVYPRNLMEWIKNTILFIKKEQLLSYYPDYVILYNFPAVASLRLLRYCRNNNIKVIHDLTEWEQTSGFCPRDIVKRLDTSLRMHYCMKKMDGVIAISKYLYNYYSGCVRTILVPPTVDLSNPKWDRQRELIVNNPITLVYAGSPGAGVKDRLDIIIEEVIKNQGIRLKVIGLTEEQFFNMYCLARQKYSNVCFLGRLPHIETIKEVCDADFQMLIRDGNRKNNAGFPTKLVESMSCGTPVISTIFSNITDYVEDGLNGFVIDDNQSLDCVFKRISMLTNENIIAMKKKCLVFHDFDYRQFKTEFAKLLS